MDMSDGIFGHLMCDETKFDEDIQWNTHSHETTGFVTDLHDLDASLQDIICGKNEMAQPAIEVNQWKF